MEVELGTIQVQFTWKLTGPRAKVESLERERFRTTLLRDHGTWYVMELCEPLDSLIDFTAPFYGHTDNHNRQRKNPVLMMNNLRCLKKHITMLSLILHLKMQW